MGALAKRCGYKGASSYQRYENSDLFTEDFLPMKLVKKLVKALEGQGVPPIERHELIELGGIAASDVNMATLLAAQKEHEPSQRAVLGSLPDSTDEESTQPSDIGQFATSRNSSEPPDTINIPELDIQVAAGGGVVVDHEHVKGQWSLPRAYIEFVLGATAPANLIMVEVKGDSMDPLLLPGDRVVVDPSDTTPSPPGIFVLWDGLGTVIKRVEHIHGSDPMTFRLISDNTLHGPYEITAEESNVVGRVVWRAGRL